MKRLMLIGSLLLVVLLGSWAVYHRYQTTITPERVAERATIHSTASMTSSMESSDTILSADDVGEVPEQAVGPQIQFIDDSGQTVTFADLPDRPTIINLWATWCPPCREEMPVFQQAFNQYGEQVNFVLIQATDSRPGETPEAATQFLREAGLDLPIYHDLNQNVQQTLGVRLLPMTLLYTRDRQLVRIHPGQMTTEQLELAVRELIP